MSEVILPWHKQPGPTEEETQAEAAAAEEARASAYVPQVGEMVAYPSHDAYASPPRERVQLVYVTGIDENGRIYGKPMGFADEGAVFEPGQLHSLA
jgi:hypothetical protein